MKDFLIKWLLNTIALAVVLKIMPGIGSDDLMTTIITSLVIGLLNAVLKPIAIFISLPLQILTLGLFTLVINGFIFYLAGLLIHGFYIKNFGTAFVSALIFSVVSYLL